MTRIGFFGEQAADAQLSHLRTSRGDHEIDFVIRRNGGATVATVAAEVKLARTVSDADVKHLHWLRQKLGDELREMIVIYSGEHAYRRRDGVVVIPLALLGP